jgi:hypothetical protein
MFPITPADLRDRDLALRHTACGYRFGDAKQTQDYDTETSAAGGADLAGTNSTSS